MRKQVRGLVPPISVCQSSYPHLYLMLVTIHTKQCKLQQSTSVQHCTCHSTSSPPFCIVFWCTTGTTDRHKYCYKTFNYIFFHNAYFTEVQQKNNPFKCRNFTSACSPFEMNCHDKVTKKLLSWQLIITLTATRQVLAVLCSGAPPFNFSIQSWETGYFIRTASITRCPPIILWTLDHRWNIQT